MAFSDEQVAIWQTEFNEFWGGILSSEDLEQNFRKLLRSYEESGVSPQEIGLN
jgi:hypothetical protein